MLLTRTIASPFVAPAKAATVRKSSQQSSRAHVVRHQSTGLKTMARHGSHSLHGTPHNARHSVIMNGTVSDRRLVDKSELITDPFGFVEDLMTDCKLDGSGCKSASKEELAKDMVSYLEKYTGLPVVDKDGKCIGVLSDKDLEKEAAQKEDCTVGEIMSSPAITIRQRAAVTFAAGLMLQNKIHRLPVVDDKDRLLGIITRTDIFEPLLCDPIDPSCGSDPIYRKDPSNPGHTMDIGSDAPDDG